METKDKILLSAAAIFLAAGMFLFSFAREQGKLRLIFCDVGQGDSILIVTSEGQQVLVDGGPGTKIVDCLSRAMPFWDRKIEAVISTHAQQDHTEGLVEVLGRYKVGMIMATGIGPKSAFFDAWEKEVEQKKKEGTRVLTASKGEQLAAGGATFDILWPPAEKIREWKTSPPSDLNETGIILRVTESKFCAYLTADVPAEVLLGVLDRPCQILKVAHHGSKTGTNDNVLSKAKPEVAIIQVGKKNRYGLPSAEVLDLLVKDRIKTLRTDLLGTIEVDFDSKGLRYSSEKI